MNSEYSDREAQRQSRVVGKIDQLFIYPLKSAEGIPISSGYAAEQARIQTLNFKVIHWSALTTKMVLRIH